jgi:hypothetical protein
MQKDIDEFTSLLKSVTKGDEQLEKYIWSFFRSINEQELSPIKIVIALKGMPRIGIPSALISDVRKKYG